MNPAPCVPPLWVPHGWSLAQGAAPCFGAALGCLRQIARRVSFPEATLKRVPLASIRHVLSIGSILDFHILALPARFIRDRQKKQQMSTSPAKTRLSNRRH